jgi:dihydroorotate dehydrogenase (NAD+) catalytic subunit
MSENNINLETSIGKLKLDNPFMTASGTTGYGEELGQFGDLKKLGAFVGKTITIDAREGNPTPRIAETSAGMINSIGLMNEGVADFVAKKLPALRARVSRLIVNIAGNTVEDYVELVKRLEKESGIDALELNVSCPNVKKGGLAFGTDAGEIRKLVTAARRETGRPMIVKLSPNVTDIAEMAKSAEDSGADAVTVANTWLGMAVDPKTRKPKIARVMGGYSGPAVKPLSLRCVYQTAKAVKIPVIGCGGICSVEDAAEFFIAGACAVQIGTWNFINPADIFAFPKKLADYLASQKMSSLKDLIGSIKLI